MKKAFDVLSNDILQFFIGLAMMVAGGYLFMNNVTVTAGNFFETTLFGRRMNGIVFVPLIASLVFLFFKYNVVSKLCVSLSLVLILANVISNMTLYWRPVTLFATVVIFVLLFGGLGLVLKCIFVNPNGKHGKNYKDIDKENEQ